MAYFQDRMMLAGCDMPRAEAVGDGVVVLVVDTANNKIVSKRFNPYDVWGSFDQPAVDVVGDLRATKQTYDVCRVGNSLAVAYPNTAGNPKVTYVTRFGQPGTAATTFANPTVMGDGYIDGAVGIAHEPSRNSLWVTYSTASVGTQIVRTIPSNTALLSASALRINTGITTAPNIERIAVAFGPEVTSGSDGHDFHAWWERSGSTGDLRAVEYSRLNQLDDLSFATTYPVRRSFLRHGLASRPWLTNRHSYVTLHHDSDLQPTFMVVREDAVVVQRLLAGGGGPTLVRPVVPGVQEVTSGSFLLPLTYRNALDVQTTSASFYSETQAINLNLGWNHSSSFTNVQTRGLAYVNGMLQTYDGVSAVEFGFHLFPEGISASFGSGSGGGLVGGQTHTWKFRWRWRDNLGNDHLSSATPLTLAVPVGANSASFSVPCLPLTMRTAEFGRQEVALYAARTIGDAAGPAASVLFRVDDPSAAVLNTTGSLVLTSCQRDSRRAAHRTRGGPVQHLLGPGRPAARRSHGGRQGPALRRRPRRTRAPSTPASSSTSARRPGSRPSSRSTWTSRTARSRPST